MQRVLVFFLLLLVCAAPTLALASSAQASGKVECPLGDDVTTAEADAAKVPAQAAGAGSGALVPGRGDSQGIVPRSRSRWQSLLPGMLK
jgi:hypothetical protein